MWGLYAVLIGLGVILVAAALYDRTAKGKARRNAGGVGKNELRTDAEDQYRALGETQHMPPSV